MTPLLVLLVIFSAITLAAGSFGFGCFYADAKRARRRDVRGRFAK